MFQSVIERQGLRSGRLGTGAWVSFGVHAGLVALVLFISGRPPEAPEEKDPVLIFRQGPAIQKGTPAPAKPVQANTPKPKPRPKDRMPTHVKPLPQDPPKPVEPDPTDGPTEPQDGPSTGEDGPIGDPNGDPNSTSPIGYIPQPGIEALPTGTDVIPFGQGMTRPSKVAGAAIEYSREALEARVEGLVVAKCTISREGDVRDCRILKGVPYMDQAVLGALESWRYSPVTYQGRSVSVSYVFTVHLKLPR